ncbi:unnamed protein product [Effrenium voratum]|nr:unnamed protein product [Effrenium voratum]
MFTLYFQKACVLFSLERYEEALADLKKVRCLAPKEASVHFQLGKVYMKLQKDRKALFHFNIAMDLNRDSKDYHTIKTNIEKLHLHGISEDPGDGPMPRMVPTAPVVVAGTGLPSPQLYQGLSPGRDPQTPVRGLGGYWSSGSGAGPERVRAYPVPRPRSSPVPWGGSPTGLGGFRI